MQTVFSNLLKINPPAQRSSSGRSSSGRSSSGASCPPNPATAAQAPVSMSGDTAAPTSTSFLKTLLLQQQESAESLMATAKKINPVVKSINQTEDAYDAAFESDKVAPVPHAGQTLQGFAVILFVFSYIALALVGTIAINAITQSGRIAAGAFVGFVVLGALLLTIIVRLA